MNVMRLLRDSMTDAQSSNEEFCIFIYQTIIRMGLRVFGAHYTPDLRGKRTVMYI